MAERLAIAYNARLKLHNFEVSSAGTHAVPGRAMEPHAARVLETLGGDASDFVSRQLTTKVVTHADLVLTMTRAHRDEVLELAPRLLNRTFTLSEAALLVLRCNATDVVDLAEYRPGLAGHLVSDIPDPIGQDEAFFAAVGAQIAELLPPVLDLCRRD
jgi:protein-tyrosine phosphatase